MRQDKLSRPERVSVSPYLMRRRGEMDVEVRSCWWLALGHRRDPSSGWSDPSSGTGFVQIVRLAACRAEISKNRRAAGASVSSGSGSERRPCRFSRRRARLHLPESDVALARPQHPEHYRPLRLLALSNSDELGGARAGGDCLRGTGGGPETKCLLRGRGDRDAERLGQISVDL